MIAMLQQKWIGRIFLIGLTLVLFACGGASQVGESAGDDDTASDPEIEKGIEGPPLPDNFWLTSDPEVTVSQDGRYQVVISGSQDFSFEWIFPLHNCLGEERVTLYGQYFDVLLWSGDGAEPADPSHPIDDNPAGFLWEEIVDPTYGLPAGRITANRDAFYIGDITFTLKTIFYYPTLVENCFMYEGEGPDQMTIVIRFD